MNRLFQGRTNNHIGWAMVDATDFATPESALSAATKIKIYGKLQGATGVNFVTSGTGSLTNDIVHVGASALGLYTIALAKADLSDASAAWYDQYFISLSATGAAYQALVCEGVLSGGNISGISAALSDVQSYLIAMSGALSDVDSALTSQFNSISDAVSNVYSAVLLTQSLASDAASAAAQANSRVLLGNSMISDVDSALTSQLVATSAILSDILSVTRGNSDAVSNVYSLLTLAKADTSQILDDTGTTGVVIATTMRAGIRKNVALAKFEFLMTDSTNHNPATGLTCAVTRSIDGGAFAAGTLSAVTEVSAGIYYVDFAAGDLNGEVITLRVTATAADDLLVTIVTDP